MSRIYLVKTPNGQRLVESGTKGQAINHCVSSDYSAEPISAADLHAYLQAGATVEKAETKGKKPDTTQSPSPAPNAPAATVATAPGATTAALNAANPAGGAALAPAAASNAQLNGLPLPSTLASQDGSLAPAPNSASGLNLSSNTSAPSQADVEAKQRASSVGGGWAPPQGANSNPVIAEQQRINPDAAAAAGAPAPRPAGILPLAPTPGQPAAEQGWVQRN